MDMRGLQNFIVEIRKATSNREEEIRRVEQELGKIRNRFKSSSDLSAYDRKKYVCKLLFIFMLGYEVDFGHMEAIALLAGSSPTEKLIGYLAVSLLLHEDHELLTLATHTIHKHLAEAQSELDTCLALTAIANVGGMALASATAGIVQLMASGQWASATQSKLTSSTIVRTKSLLTCLKVFRKGHNLIDPAVVGPAACRLIASHDMSQAACAVTLVVAFKSEPEAAPSVKDAREQCMRALTRIIMDRDTQREYIYYAVPAPWFQVKAIRCLQMFTPPESSTERADFETVLLRMVRGTENVIQESQQQKSSKGNSSLANRCNVMVAVLVEIVALAIQWDFSDALVAACQETVSLLLNDKRDANLRYLGLLLLSRLSYCPSLAASFSEDLSKHHALIVNSLHDPDQSIRRQALDLMYAMCDRRNAAEVLGELLSYLPASQPAFREGLVLMVAVLAEKFCTELTWYVEVITTMIEQAGEHCGTAVWHRLCHVVVNAPSVQKVAVDLLLRAVANCNRENDVLLKTAAFLLGEFGYQVALGTGTGPVEQLNALHTKFPFASDETKAVLLTTYLKFYNLYDNATVRDKIVKIFKTCRSSFDPEIQARASEYYHLVSHVADDVLQAALEALPPFELQNNNAVLERLRERQLGAEDRNIWSDKATARDEQHLAESAVAAAARGVDQAPTAATEGAAGAADGTQPKDSSGDQVKIAPPIAEAVAAAPAASGGTPQHVRQTYIDPTTAVPTLSPPPQAGGSLDDILGPVVKPKPLTTGASDRDSAATMIEQNARRFVEVSASPQGVLHLDAVIRARFTAEFRAADGRFTLRVENVTQGSLTNFDCRLSNQPANLILQMRPVTQGSLATPGGSTDVQLACRVQGCFDVTPTVAISAVLDNGTAYATTMQLPITAPRFVEPYLFTEEVKFQGLWQATTTPTDNQTKVVSFGSEVSRRIAGGPSPPVAVVQEVLSQRCKLHCVPSASDILSSTILAMGASAYWPADAVKYDPVLVKAEECTATSCRITVRGKDPRIAPLMLSAIVAQFERGPLPAD